MEVSSVKVREQDKTINHGRLDLARDNSVAMLVEFRLELAQYTLEVL
ncbi:unnamed protein product [marine sediment metagenome]|uniref:Uncharacterized protein n=1 Tax=marine sediment metagenome TaxID=412755 RepID=X1CX13_9ZZZZ